MAFHLLRYQLANRPHKWSFKGTLDNIRQRTRSLFERLFRGRQNSDLVERVNNFKPDLTQNVRKSQFGIFEKVSQWSRETFASVLAKRKGHRVFRDTAAPVLSFTGFALSKKTSLLTEDEELEGLSFEIRDVFSKISPESVYTEPQSCPSNMLLTDLDIGELLAKGCNAVVYSARVKNLRSVSTIYDENFEKIDEETIDDLTHYPENENCDMKEQSLVQVCNIRQDGLYPFDLAVKMMFNYCAESNATTILRTMFKETLPAIQKTQVASVCATQKMKVPPHPNIVRMYYAFVDKTPLLPNALSIYPQALPQRITADGFGRNMTLFLIMKRYNLSLTKFLEQHPPDLNTSLILFCQLLEGLVHLLQNDFVHRDLKTDNILVDLTYGTKKPAIVITDFGCCLEGAKLSYATEEVDRGGNWALMAPEVATAEAGPFSIIDYSRADLWTLGTMAYEIFCGKNPFYDDSSWEALHSSTYCEEDLPPLSEHVPALLQSLIKDMLRRDPKKRPSPTLAATICQLYLHAPHKLLSNCRKKQNTKKLANWMCVFSAETYIKASQISPDNSSIEFQLSHTWCRRFQFQELFEAMQYISQI